MSTAEHKQQVEQYAQIAFGRWIQYGGRKSIRRIVDRAFPFEPDTKGESEVIDRAREKRAEFIERWIQIAGAAAMLVAALDSEDSHENALDVLRRALENK